MTRALTPPEPVSLAEFDRLFESIKNWGRWGKNDEIFPPAGAMRLALDFLACGLDPQKTVFFRQSDVPEVTELTWILGTVTPMGLLERCHSYKDKLARGLAATHGLFSFFTDDRLEGQYRLWRWPLKAAWTR